MSEIIPPQSPPPVYHPEPEAPSVTAKDYDDRNGYMADFLGSEPEFLIPLPVLLDEADMVKAERAPAGSPYELRYQNFSVAMCRSRRLCCVSAVNIAGNAAFFHPKRPGWKIDPRIPAEFQVDGTSFYVPTVFDRGHMVRRLDPVWGEEASALVANKDTHHYTNSCPQVHSFNDGNWGDLEDWILSQEQSRDSMGSVFTGPVFSADDPVYKGVAVPVKFYKIVAVIDDETGELSVTAFLLDQSSVMPPVEEDGAVPEAPFDPGRFDVYQVKVSDLEEMGGMNFGPLNDFDVLSKQAVPDGPAQESPTWGWIPLRSARDALLWTNA